MAGIPAAITVNKLMPRTPTNAAICITSIFVDQIYPIKFQGNPVNSHLRTHSLTTQITENKSKFDIKILDFLNNYQVDELESIEVNLDEQFTTLYLDGISSEKLIILINLLNSSGLSTEENFAEVHNKLKGSIKVFLYE